MSSNKKHKNGELTSLAINVLFLDILNFTLLNFYLKYIA